MLGEGAPSTLRFPGPLSEYGRILENLGRASAERSPLPLNRLVNDPLSLSHSAAARTRMGGARGGRSTGVRRRAGPVADVRAGHRGDHPLRGRTDQRPGDPARARFRASGAYRDHRSRTVPLPSPAPRGESAVPGADDTGRPRLRPGCSDAHDRFGRPPDPVRRDQQPDLAHRYRIRAHRPRVAGGRCSLLAGVARPLPGNRPDLPEISIGLQRALEGAGLVVSARTPGCTRYRRRAADRLAE